MGRSKSIRNAGGRLRSLVVSGGALVAALGASAFTLPPPMLRAPAALDIPPANGGVLHTSEDAAERMTVPVLIDGKGPFPFVIDTGADHTVVSRELADALHLPADAPVLVHGTGGDDLEPTAHVDDLVVGGRRLTGLSAPVLSAVNLGAMGMLGIDALHDQRMVIDLRHHTLAVEPSRKERREAGTVVVHAKSRYGQLILVDAAVRDQPIAVILDSGAQNTIGNSALERLIGHIGVTSVRLGGDVVSVTGRTTPAYFSELPDVQIGGVELNNQPVAFADLHTFTQFGLQHEPAMLLGMDTLHVFDRVVVDFARKEVRFKLGAPPERKTPIGLVTVADAR